MKKLVGASLAMLSVAFGGHSVLAAVISNGIPSGTINHFSVDVTTGGESRTADITANRAVSADTFTEDFLFDYFTYVDVGNGGFRLSGSAPVGDSSSVTSSGSFLGAANNAINWSVESSINSGESLMTNTFTFTAQTGTIGDLRLFQYLDEDIEAFSDDVFLTRGSVANGDLELFTIDNTELYGVSHGGAYSSAQGLENSSFAGWAADNFNDIKPRLAAGTQSVSPTGLVDASLTPFSHPALGAAFGPRDIVSVLAWDIDPDSSTGTIITTLGGVPDVDQLPPPRNIPEPTATVGLWAIGALGARSVLQRQKKQESEA